MKSYDVVGYVPPDAGYVLCPKCAKGHEEEYAPVFADSEWDYYPTCDKCGEQITDVNLTSDGRKYEAAQKVSRTRKPRKSSSRHGASTILGGMR